MEQLEILVAQNDSILPLLHFDATAGVVRNTYAGVKRIY